MLDSKTRTKLIKLKKDELIELLIEITKIFEFIISKPKLLLLKNY